MTEGAAGPDAPRPSGVPLVAQEVSRSKEGGGPRDVFDRVRLSVQESPRGKGRPRDGVRLGRGEEGREGVKVRLC